MYVSTGLHIVYTQDEVDVVQNLMFYIEAAYKVAVSPAASLTAAVRPFLKQPSFFFFSRIMGCGREETKPTRASRRSTPAPSAWPRLITHSESRA